MRTVPGAPRFGPGRTLSPPAPSRVTTACSSSTSHDTKFVCVGWLGRWQRQHRDEYAALCRKR
ncbi:hypothetical protein [Mariniluteicoccus endophyticus]